MSNFTLQNMTPGNAADCYLPGCNGVVGGLCVGALPTGANVNQTLWWCCTPYAETCRGGQSACPGTNCSNGSASWCCNEELESCPGEDGLEGSCVPKNYTNPVLDGPAWGPGASSAVSGSASSTIASSSSTIPSSSSSSSSSSTAPASATATASVAPTETSAATGDSGSGGGISAGAAAGVGVVGGGLFVLAAVGAVWFFRRRRRGPGARGSRHFGELDAGSKNPIEMEGRSMHEMEGVANVRGEMEADTKATNR